MCVCHPITPAQAWDRARLPPLQSHDDDEGVDRQTEQQCEMPVEAEEGDRAEARGQRERRPHDAEQSRGERNATTPLRAHDHATSAAQRNPTPLTVERALNPARTAYRANAG